MIRSISLKHLLAVLFLAGMTHAGVLVEWVLHSDKHITDHHADIVRYISLHAGFKIQKPVVSIPSLTDTWSDSFRQGLEHALQILPSNDKELNLIISSHGGQGIVQHHTDEIRLREIIDDLIATIGQHEAKHGPILINMIYNACYSGSLEAPLKALWAESALKSTINVLMSAPEDRVSHSTILVEYIRKADQRLYEIEKGALAFSNGASTFQKLAKLAAGNNFNKTDKPTAWSSDPVVNTWSYTDALTESLTDGITTSRILKDEAMLERIWQSLPENSLLHYLFKRNLTATAKNISHLEPVVKFLDQDLPPSTLETFMAKGIDLPLRGAVLGWISVARPQYAELVERLHARFEVPLQNGERHPNAQTVLPKWAFMEARFDFFVHNKNLDLALAEFDKIADIPVGWQHSTSLLLPVRHNSAKKLIALFNTDYLTDSDTTDLLISKILKMTTGQKSLIQELLEKDSALLAQHPRLMDLAVKSGFTDVLMSKLRGYSVALIESIHRVGEVGLIHSIQYDHWKSELAKGRNFYNDDARKRANELFGLNLKIWSPDPAVAAIVKARSNTNQPSCRSFYSK